MAFPFLLSTILAVFAGSLVFLAPGFLVHNLFKRHLAIFGEASVLLWSLALSPALSIVFAVIVGSLLSQRRVGFLFIALDLCALAIIVGQMRHTHWLRRPFPAKKYRFYAAVFSIAAVWLITAEIPIETRHSLWESVASADWSVRVPLIIGAARSGEPLLNYFNHIGGSAPRLAYYFYWYQVQGVLAATFNLPGRAVMAAGCVWACWSSIATLLLAFRCLFRPENDRESWSTKESLKWLLLAAPILGLDIVQVAIGAAHHRIFPETEWWRAPDGLAPSFQTAFLYAPHHATGIATAMVGFLILIQHRLTDHEQRCKQSWKSFAVACGLTSICFAAVVGSSTYVGLFMVFACIIFGADQLWRKRWEALFLLAIVGLLTTLFSLPFLRAMQTREGAGASKHEVPVTFELREFSHTYYSTESYIVRYTHIRVGRAVTYLSSVPVYVLSMFAEGGFLFLVVLYRAKVDVSDNNLQERQRLQWVLASSCIGPAALLSSKFVAGPNDLGFHAALMLRYVAVLWAMPLLRDLFRPYRTQSHPWWLRSLALPLIVMGLMLQAWQVFEQRTLLYLNDHGLHTEPGPFPSAPQLGMRYKQVFALWRYITDHEPQNAVILTNPNSHQRSLAMIYVTRQLVAPEPHCMTAFGGSPERCKVNIARIESFYSGAMTSVADVGRLCRDNGITAIVIADDDPVWRIPTNWIWRTKPAYSGFTERLLQCPDR